MAPTTGPVSVFAVHDFTAGATASQFAIDDQSGLTYTGANILHAVFVVADPLDVRKGVGVTYDAGCNGAPIAVVEFVFTVLGTEPECGTIDVVADPTAVSGQIEGVDCSFLSTFPHGGVFVTNAVGHCSCNPGPVEETSWGRIKSLYR